jgi:hypothetical protein
MIPVLLRQMRWRLMGLLFAAWIFYLIEPAFHQHDVEPTSVEQLLLPPEIAKSGANLAALSVAVLLAGFISAHRRRGYYRLQLSHPTSPLALYGLHWALSVVVAIGISSAFLMLSQLAAWGTVRVGLQFALLPVMFAIIYGGVAAALSAALRLGDGVATVVVYFVTASWMYVVNTYPPELIPSGPARLLSFVLPPHTAATDVFDALVRGEFHWAAASYCVGYGIFWLILAGLLVRTREWP